jgi:two-component system phosphate regulon response regulator PhoB
MPTMKTILFVEDDAVIVQAYRMGLERAGFRVEVAKDGLDAMKILLLLKPNLVLLDLMMPKFSGTDVLKYIRSTPALKSTPVIILSNASIADQGQEAMALGADRVFLKALCTPRQLIGAANELLNSMVPPPQPAVPNGSAELPPG